MRYTEEQARDILDRFYRLNSEKEQIMEKVRPIQNQMDELIEPAQCCFDQGYGYLLDEYIRKY